MPAIWMGCFFSVYITITTTATTHDISTLFWNKMAKEKVIIVWRHGREIRLWMAGKDTADYVSIPASNMVFLLEGAP
jgi:hypothetical protein